MAFEADSWKNISPFSQGWFYFLICISVQLSFSAQFNPFHWAFPAEKTKYCQPVPQTLLSPSQSCKVSTYPQSKHVRGVTCRYLDLLRLLPPSIMTALAFSELSRVFMAPAEPRRTSLFIYWIQWITGRVTFRIRKGNRQIHEEGATCLLFWLRV